MYWVYSAGKEKNTTVIYGVYSKKNALQLKKRMPEIMIIDFKTGNLIDEKGHQIYRNKIKKIS